MARKEGTARGGRQKRRGRVLTERKRREGENQTEERIEPQSLSQLDANKRGPIGEERRERRREAQRGTACFDSTCPLFRRPRQERIANRTRGR